VRFERLPPRWRAQRLVETRTRSAETRVCPNCAHTEPNPAHLRARRLTLSSRSDGAEMV
jgi:hypothetical protein